MANIKKLTLLHSNDLHGDFLAENVDSKLVGGVSLLSGYINKVRREESNVLYCIAGDMFRGSVIDSEYRGISTIEIMNALAPDVVTIGNHEVDYGVAHLLFIEKCAKFPIINANLYIKTNNAHLFAPYKVVEIDGMNILFIGILTEEVLRSCKSDPLIGSLIDTAEAAKEVERIVNAHQRIDIDFTVLLTHIGFEEDKKLAELLNPECGVDVIVGGHSHTFIDEPAVVNGIPIVQAGTGTDLIGRMDIEIDTDTNSISSYTWKAVPIDDTHCERDEQIENLISSYKEVTDRKYSRVVTRFSEELTHPKRNQETSLGNLFSDILTDSLGVNICFLGSGSIRGEKLGPIVTYGDLCAIFPYDDQVHMVTVDGEQIKTIFRHLFRDDAWVGHTEFYQVPKCVEITYSKSKHDFEKFLIDGKEPGVDDRFDLAIQHYHFSSFEDFFGVDLKDTEKYGKSRIISTSIRDILDAYMSEHSQLYGEVEGRMEILD